MSSTFRRRRKALAKIKEAVRLMNDSSLDNHARALSILDGLEPQMYQQIEKDFLDVTKQPFQVFRDQVAAGLAHRALEPDDGLPQPGSPEFKILADQLNKQMRDQGFNGAMEVSFR